MSLSVCPQKVACHILGLVFWESLWNEMSDRIGMLLLPIFREGNRLAEEGPKLRNRLV